MTRKHYEDRATLRDNEWAARHLGTEGASTSRRTHAKSATYKTQAIGEQARAVKYLEACRDGQFGEYGIWLVDEYLPRGINIYPPGDQVACASRIMASIASFETTGYGIAPFNSPTGETLRAMAAKDVHDLYGD